MALKNKLISVIIPAYNAELHIDRAIDSIISQTYKNIEIILIDDGSIDNTGKIAEEYARKDSRVRVYHVENGGEAKSRNLGVKVAKGEYIGFCDADDRMHPDMIQKMIEAIYKDDSDIAICGWNYLDESGKALRWKRDILSSQCLSTSQVKKYFFTTNSIEGFCWNKLFKVNLFKNEDIKYDEERLSYCDIIANYKMICSANKVSYIGEALYDYYQVMTACTHVPNIKKNYDFYRVMESFRALVKTEDDKINSNVYILNRMSKHLYSMRKEKEMYDYEQYREFYLITYENYLKVSMIKKLVLAAKYSVDSKVKQLVKVFFVASEYHMLKREIRK